MLSAGVVFQQQIWGDQRRLRSTSPVELRDPLGIAGFRESASPDGIRLSFWLRQQKGRSGCCGLDETVVIESSYLSSPPPDGAPHDGAGGLEASGLGDAQLGAAGSGAGVGAAIGSGAGAR